MTTGPAARCVIAEDEEVLREELASSLRTLWPELELRAAVGDGAAALEALEAHSPHVLFLDIQMPGISGLEIARRASGRCHVVFVTAYDQFAVEAFESGAVDYVMKPLAEHRLSLAVERLKRRFASDPANLESVLERLALRIARPKSYLRWINASQGDELRLIMVEDVCYFKSDAKYTCVVQRARESIVRRSLRDLGEQLDPESFWQVHRSIIVNLAHIDSVHGDFRGRLLIKLKQRSESLPVSQSYAHLFKQT